MGQTIVICIGSFFFFTFAFCLTGSIFSAVSQSSQCFFFYFFLLPFSFYLLPSAAFTFPLYPFTSLPLYLSFFRVTFCPQQGITYIMKALEREADDAER